MASMFATMIAFSVTSFLLAGCAPPSEVRPSDPEEQLMSDTLQSFAARYAEAWSSHDASSVAALYSENGSLKVNDNEPAIGRAAITEVAQDFMTAFPDMRITNDGVNKDSERVIFRWTWTGSNTGPGGTGRTVNISGYEEWRFGPDGLIAESLGHFDSDEYERQLSGAR